MGTSTDAKSKNVDLASIRWLTMPQACEYANACRKTLRRLLLEGSIKGDRFGGGEKSRWRIDRESIDAYFTRSGDSVLAKLESLGL